MLVFFQTRFKLWNSVLKMLNFQNTEKLISLHMHFKILGKRLYSSSLKDVTWLEDIQLIFLIFHTSVCIFFPANRIYPAKFADMIMEYNNKDYRINK